jgi:N-acetylglucosamine-6-phosphate deacetylase
MASDSNGLIRFTNCLLPQEDGSLVKQDLWIDEKRGVVLDPLVSFARVLNLAWS